MESWYDPMIFEVKAVEREKDLRDLMARQVQQIQDSDKKWAKSYILPADFVNTWAKWIENGESRGAIKPGPIDNKAFKKSLIKRSVKANGNTEGFLEVSKILFMYFAHFFGGGPCIVHTNELYSDQNSLIKIEETTQNSQRWADTES